MADAPQTVVDALARAATHPRPGVGLRFIESDVDAATLSPWSTVAARAARVTGALLARGVRPGERVATVLPTAPTFFDALFGVLGAGAVPVPLYPPVRLGRLDTYVDRTAAMLRAADAVAVLTDRRIVRLLGRVDAAYPTRLGLLDTDALRDAGPAAAAVPADPDALALVQFSSGTTGDPKPVALTHRAILANARAVLDVVESVTPLDGDPGAHGVCWLPLYHDMGLIGCVLPALIAPGPLTLIPPERFLVRPALWLQAISRWRGTISPAPDFAYALCTDRVRDDELDGVDLSSWKMALDGAEPVGAATLDAFADRFARWGFDRGACMPVYGLSEMALAVTFTPAGRGARVLRLDRAALAEGRAEPAAADAVDPAIRTTCGPSLAGFDVRIVDDHGAACPADRIGDVEVTGPSAMQGYLGRTESPFTRDGWLRTGDRGFLTGDGELVITGRAKDLIVVRGRNHDPSDLERAASAVDGVRDGCVVAVGEVDDDGERVIVLAEARDPRDGLAADVIAAVRRDAGLTPDLVVVLDPGTLPRTSSGKLRRAEALRQFRAGTLLPPDAVTPIHLAGALAASAIGRLRAAWSRGRP